MSFFKNLLGRGHHDGGNTSHQQGGKHHGRAQSHGGGLRNDWGNSAANQNICANCNAGNQAGTRFCQQCGNALLPKNCGGCGAVKIAGAKFCGNCGMPQ
ncbi:hypothetical protein LT85_2270 [Collimonas arenae]|uniref:DZANK-type domain-containing protein n=1 Tax=Collimonas arenae TaxID=279058 RepID=A0A0A1F9L0_9BURK|nr:hypothetical protein LT85_2270 [Collimonas arenae]